MANTVQVTQVMDGSRIVLHVWLQSDGASGDLNNYVLIDPTKDITPPMLPGRDLTMAVRPPSS